MSGTPATDPERKQLQKQIRDKIYKHLDSRYLLEDGEDALQLAVNIMPLIDTYTASQATAAQEEAESEFHDIVPCGYCGKSLLRNPQYCNHSHRQRAYMLRKKEASLHKGKDKEST